MTSHGQRRAARAPYAFEGASGLCLGKMRPPGPEGHGPVDEGARAAFDDQKGPHLRPLCSRDLAPPWGTDDLLTGRRGGGGVAQVGELRSIPAEERRRREAPRGRGEARGPSAGFHPPNFPDSDPPNLLNFTPGLARLETVPVPDADSNLGDVGIGERPASEHHRSPEGIVLEPPPVVDVPGQNQLNVAAALVCVVVHRGVAASGRGRHNGVQLRRTPYSRGRRVSSDWLRHVGRAPSQEAHMNSSA
jgi:hypothetical protein